MVAFYGFFRLASLLPTSGVLFNRTRFPVVGDIVTCAKSMHTSGEYQVVQTPKLQEVELCPVIAFRTMLKYLCNVAQEVPLLKVKTRNSLGLLTAPKVHSFKEANSCGNGSESSTLHVSFFQKK